MEVQYFVRGRKDSKPRVVEHIPRDMDLRKTHSDKLVPNHNGYLMRYHGDDGAISIRTICSDRIEARTIKPTGPM